MQGKMTRTKNVLLEKVLNRRMSNSPHRTMKRRFSCDVCKQQFVLKDHLKLHMGVHKANVVLQRVEGVIPKTKSSGSKTGNAALGLNNTSTSAPSAKRKQFVCSHCSYQCSQRSLLNKHMGIHTSKEQFHQGRVQASGFRTKQRFPCHVCEYQFDLEDYLKVHMGMHTATVTSVRMVETGFVATETVENDYNTSPSIQVKQFICSLCDYQCSRKYLLNKHMSIHTSEEQLDQDRVQVSGFCRKKQRFSCPFCEYQFDLEDHLKVHVGMHTTTVRLETEFSGTKTVKNYDNTSPSTPYIRANPLICSLCKYQCGQGYLLDMHMATHKEEDMLRCRKCKYRCSQQHRMEVHMLIHKQRKVLACAKCKYESDFRQNMIAHMHIHLPKRYGCAICRRNFRDLDTLKAHKDVHLSNSYPCPTCHRNISGKIRFGIHVIRCRTLNRRNNNASRFSNLMI